MRRLFVATGLVTAAACGGEDDDGLCDDLRRWELSGRSLSSCAAAGRQVDSLPMTNSDRAGAPRYRQDV